MKPLIRILFFLFAVLFARPVFSEDKQPLPTSFPLTDIPKILRVALYVDTPAVSINIAGPYQIRAVEGEPFSLAGKQNFTESIGSVLGGIRMQKKILKGSVWEFEGLSGEVKVDRRNYGRVVRLLKRPKGLTIVHDVSLEEYLRGVLPMEMFTTWPIEALKAQAVVSRTYALFKSIEKRDEDFMLRDTVMSQVYGGTGAHHPATDRAIAETKGEILTFQGEIFPAYFHANCGGVTAKAHEIWFVVPNEVFENARCSFCKNTPHEEWSLEMSLKEVEEAMNRNGYPAKNLKLIRFEDRDPSGRARKVFLQYQRSEVTISADDFRFFIGTGRLKSLKSDVLVSNGKVKFKGRGWGHGIGLCQWGARGQAMAGKNYREILLFYFPKSEIRKI